jgi:hypothetical protein
MEDKDKITLSSYVYQTTRRHKGEDLNINFYLANTILTAKLLLYLRLAVTWKYPHTVLE